MDDQIIPLTGHDSPHVDGTAYVAPGARVIGNVTLSAHVGIWFNAVLRADSDAITIGAGSNIQDNVSCHGDPGFSLVVGRNVSVGHNAVLHGCTIEDDCLIGMGAIVMNGAVVGAGSLVAGVPAKVRRALTPDEQADIRRNAESYRARIALYRAT